MLCPPPNGEATPHWCGVVGVGVAAVLFAGEPPYLIVDVNDAWLQTCGFSRVEIIGKPMTMIQGPATERNLIRDLLLAVKRRQPHYSTVLTNYTKGGEVFKNTLEISLVGAADGLASEHFLARSTIEWITIESHGTCRRTPWPSRFRKPTRQVCKGLACACCVPGSAAVCGEQLSSNRSSLRGVELLMPTTPLNYVMSRKSDSESEMSDLQITDDEESPVMTSACNTAPPSGQNRAVHPAAATIAAWFGSGSGSGQSGVMSAAEAATALFVPKTMHCRLDGAQRPMFVQGYNFFPSCTSPEIAAYRRHRRQRAIARLLEKKRRRQAAGRVAGRHKYGARTLIASCRPRLKGRFVKTSDLVTMASVLCAAVVAAAPVVDKDSIGKQSFWL